MYDISSSDKTLPYSVVPSLYYCVKPLIAELLKIYQQKLLKRNVSYSRSIAFSSGNGIFIDAMNHTYDLTFNTLN